MPTLVTKNKDWVESLVRQYPNILSTLSPRSELIMCYLYFEKKSVNEIAIRFSVTCTRINQIHRKSLRVLRMREKYIANFSD